MADQLAIPWDLDSFFHTFDHRFRSMAHKANWTDSGDDVEDLVQEMWEHVWKQWDKAQFWTEKTVVTHASKTIRTMAKSRRIEYEEFRCEYVYDRPTIKGYLENVAWAEDDECIDLDARMDLRQAFDQLTPVTRRAVFGYYALGRRYERGSAQERALSRGIDELYYRLNSNLPRTTASFEELAEQETSWMEN